MEHNAGASHRYLTSAIALGMLAGAAAGLLYLDNIGFGAVIGIIFAIPVGVSLESKNAADDEAA